MNQRAAIQNEVYALITAIFVFTVAVMEHLNLSDQWKYSGNHKPCK